MVRRKKELRPELRLYSDTNAELIAWVEELDSLPHGYKAQAIKETLRQGRGEGSPVNPSAPAALDIRALVDHLRPELRPMVEAVEGFEAQLGALMLALKDNQWILVTGMIFTRRMNGQHLAATRAGQVTLIPTPAETTGFIASARM